MNSSSSTLNQHEISDPEFLCKQPLVSVLMITYNHEPFIAEAIEGVVTQVCDFDFELIIGEDCSPDKTLSVAKEYQKKYPSIIRIITADENVGFAENLRRIIDGARGQFSDFCEGDDYWIDNQKLADEVKLFNSNSDIGIVHGDHVFRYDFWGKKFIVNPQGRYANFLEKARLSGDISGRVLPWVECVTHTCTVSFKTCYLKELIDSEESNFTGAFYDRCITLYCSIKCKAAYIDRPVSAYRVWGGSMMRSGEVGTLRINFEIFKYFHLLSLKCKAIADLDSPSRSSDYAMNLYFRSLLNNQTKYSHALEKQYLKKEHFLSIKTKLKIFLYQTAIIKFIYCQHKYLQKIYLMFLNYLTIYFAFKKRVEIK